MAGSPKRGLEVAPGRTVVATIDGSSSARAHEAGYHAIQFDAVVETNEGAFRLWQRLGCRIIGTVREAFDAAEDGLVGLHVMYLQLRERQG